VRQLPQVAGIAGVAVSAQVAVVLVVGVDAVGESALVVVAEDAVFLPAEAILVAEVDDVARVALYFVFRVMR